MTPVGDALLTALSHEQQIEDVQRRLTEMQAERDTCRLIIAALRQQAALAATESGPYARAMANRLRNRAQREAEHLLWPEAQIRSLFAQLTALKGTAFPPSITAAE